MTVNAVKAAAWTALFSFVTLFGLSLAGWLQDVWEWSQDTSGVVLFPDPGVLFKAAVSAAVSAVIGFVNFAVRWAQTKTGVGEGTVPRY